MKHPGKAAFGIFLTVFLLWFVMKDVDFADVIANIAKGDVLLLSASVLVATFGFVIRAMRWRILLLPVLPESQMQSRFASVSIGFMANNILPARIGEFARPYALQAPASPNLRGRARSEGVSTRVRGAVRSIFQDSGESQLRFSPA